MAHTARKTDAQLKAAQAPRSKAAHGAKPQIAPQPQLSPQPPRALEAPVLPKGIDDPTAPEFFASGCCGFSIGQGHVTLTFESVRCNHFDANGAMTRVVVGRVVMPVQAAQALVLELNNSLQRSGFSPSRAATMGMVAQ
jgi:hypothetical protein